MPESGAARSRHSIVCSKNGSRPLIRAARHRRGKVSDACPIHTRQFSSKTNSMNNANNKKKLRGTGGEGIQGGAGRWTLGLYVALLAIVLSGCAITRNIVAPYAKVEMVGVQTLNPDADGRPSPLSVLVMELSSRTVFDSLDFDAAFTNGETVLGDDLLSFSEHVILPGQRLEHKIELSRSANYVAIV